MSKDYLPKNTLSTKATIISFGKLSLSLSHLIAAAFLSYNFSKADYGAFRQVWLIYHTMVPILTLGLPMSINYFIPQMKSAKRKAINFQTFFLLTISGFVLSIVLFLGAPQISQIFKNPELVETLRIFSLVPILAFPALYYQNLFVCLNKAVLATKLSLLMAFGYLSSSIVPVLFGYSVKEIFICFNIFSFIQLIIVSFLMFKPFKKYDTEWNKNLLFNQLKYAIPIGLTAIVGILNKQLDKLLISSLFSVSQFATYINGAFEIPLIGIITGSVTAVLMPEFVKLWHKRDTVGLMKVWDSAIRKVALIIFPVMCFLFVSAPEFITLLFSQKYFDSSVIFRIYLLALLVRITNFGMVLLAIGLSSIVLRYSIYSLILNIGLNFIFIKAIGFPGPAVATVIVAFTMAFLQLNKISKEIEIPFKKIFPWKALLQLLIIALAASGVLQIAKLLNPYKSQITSLIIGGVLYIIVFFVIGFFSKVLSKKDIQIPLKIIKGILNR